MLKHENDRYWQLCGTFGDYDCVLTIFDSELGILLLSGFGTPPRGKLVSVKTIILVYQPTL